MNFIYRFDYKYKNLPYYIYVKFKHMPATSTLARIKRKMNSYCETLVTPAEYISVINHDIPIVEYKELRKVFLGQRPTKKIEGKYPDLFSDVAPY